MIVLRGDAKPGIGTGDLVSLTHLALGLESIGIKTVLATQDTKEARSILHSHPHQVWYLPVQNPLDCAQSFQLTCLSKKFSTIFWEITECSPNKIAYHPKFRHMGIVFEELPPKEWEFVLCWDPLWAENIKTQAITVNHLCGPQYVLLHPDIGLYTHPGTTKVKKVLITMGGSDEKNYSLKILQSLRSQSLDTLSVSVICGAGYNHKTSLNSETSRWQKPPKILYNMQEIYKSFFSYDCVISAGGLTASELVFTKTPAILYATVSHQMNRCQYFSDHNWCLYEKKPDLSNFAQLFSQLPDITAANWGANKGTMAVAHKIKALLD